MARWRTRGDSARDLDFTAIGPDGNQVGVLAGEIRVHANAVATLLGRRIRPVVPGHADHPRKQPGRSSRLPLIPA